MRTLQTRHTLWIVVPLLGLWTSLAPGQAPAGNCPPTVSLLWPRQGDFWNDSFSVGTLIKLKAEATDSDGSIAQVQFFVDSTLIGVVTDPPFNLMWAAGDLVELNVTNSSWMMKAVAIDNEGARSESRPVRIGYFTGIPPWPVLEMVSPRNGELFAAPATFVFSAELLASAGGDAGPVEFFVDANSAGIVDPGTPFTATTALNSITVSNLLEGEHKLTVRFRGQDGDRCPCNWITNTIRVVKLGVQLPRITLEYRMHFDVVTSFPGTQTIIQASSDLGNWVPISTNYPSSNSFTFTEATLATNTHRFYRVLVPTQSP